MKIQDKMMEFLENKGYELGYHENLMPHINDLDIVAKNNVQVWEYMGYRSEKSFYTRSKPSALAIKEIIKKYGMSRKDYWEKTEEEEPETPKLIKYDNF
tara:strand:- start:1141 stop:1437 length:297 start_codon:yes stop_codon:yes gene_type:complete